MAAFSNYTEELLLDHLLTQGPFWIALFTVTPTDSTTGTEVSGVSYARQPATFVRVGSDLSNDTQLQFPTATEDWGIVTGMAIFDAVTAGQMIWYGGLSTAKTIAEGDTALYSIGSTILNLD